MITAILALGRRPLYWIAFAAAAMISIIGVHISGQRAGRADEQIENIERTNHALRRMLEAEVDRPRSRDDLVERLRENGF
ncbi:MAG: hypothetical protein ACK5LJ_16820 [Paracoccus sp. (in: a-proteobacteria)]